MNPPSLLLVMALSCLTAAVVHRAHVEHTEAVVRVMCGPSLPPGQVWNAQRAQQAFREAKAAERERLAGAFLAPAGICLGLLLAQTRRNESHTAAGTQEPLARRA